MITQKYFGGVHFQANRTPSESSAAGLGAVDFKTTTTAEHLATAQWKLTTEQGLPVLVCLALPA